MPHVSPSSADRPQVRRPGRPPQAAPALAAAALLLALAAPAQALRVVTWNLLAYDDAAVPNRRPHMIQIVPGLNPDVMIVQELITAAAADSFANLLKATMPTKVWKGGTSTFILGTQSAFFYDSSTVSISNLTAVTTGGPRQVLVALVRPNGYKANAASFRVYSVHFKAGDGISVPTDSSQRTLECTNLRNTMNTAPANTNILMGGDTNFYGSYETGYTRLTESQADNDGRLRDPYVMSGVWNNGAYASFHTQSPCAGVGCVGSSGGMDDRFDLFLHSYSLHDGLGLDVVDGILPNGYGPYGNDGFHYNASIDAGGFNNAVGLAVASALRQASDHVPVIVTLQLPAKLAVVHALDFGDVIVGSAPTQNLSVDDLPAVPAATLTYTLAAPAGFTAPGGSFNNPAASAPNVHAIGMLANTIGAKSGTLTVNSNDLDTTAKAVLLSGRVLAHAAPSLDSLVAATSDTLDFGTVPQASTTELQLRLYNQGWNALQARLVRTAEFVAGDDRFTFTAPAPFVTDAATYAVRFAAAGAAANSDHVAELRIAPADEPLPGALASDTLRVYLKAHVAANGGVQGLPTALRFAPPAPNPLHRSTLFAFDLPHDATVSLAIYDASGRRVAQLADGAYPAGRHSVRWDASAAQSLRAGLYFARFRTPGLTRVARLVVLP